MKKLLKYMFTAAISLAAASCAKEEVNFLSLEVNGYTFSNQADTIEFKISSSQSWEAQTTSEWIEAVQTAPDSLKIIVPANETKEMRIGTVAIVSAAGDAEFHASQLPAEYKGNFVDLVKYNEACISRNGHWVGVCRYNETDYTYTPVVINTLTGEETVFTDYADFSEIVAISNDGKTIFFSKDIETYCVRNGEFVDLNIPDGYSMPYVEAINEDATIWVGFMFNGKEFNYVPVRWTNGEPEILEYPELSASGYENYNGAMARGCSADGSVIYGSEWTDWGLVYWKDGEMFYPGLDFAEKKTVIIDGWFGPEELEVTCTYTMTASNANISANGRYIATDYNDYMVVTEGEPAEELRYAAVIDTEKNEAIQFTNKDTGIPSTTGITVNDEGILFGASPAQLCDTGMIFDLKDKSSMTLSEWFNKTMGIQIGAERMVSKISTNGNIFFGMTYCDNALRPGYKYWYYIVDPSLETEE